MKYRPYSKGGNSSQSARSSKAFCASLVCKVAKFGQLGRWGTQIITTARQAKFDLNVPGEMTLSGKGILGGEIVLAEDEYSINWIIINKQGKGFSANVENAREIQQVIDEMTGGPN